MSDAEFGSESLGGVDYGDFAVQVKSWVLSRLAASAAAAVPSSSPQAAMMCFRLRAGGAGLELAATDMERTVFASSLAVVVVGGVPEGSYFEAFIPAKKLLAILKEVPDADVTVSVKKNRAVITAGDGSWGLALPDSSEYPVLLELGEQDFTRYPREKLLDALGAVQHAVCRDAGQPTLTQVDISHPPGSEGWCVTAASNSRFARVSLEDFPQPVSVPLPVLAILMRVLQGGTADVGIAVTEESLAFQVGPVVLAVARRSTPFPDMDRQLLLPARENDQELSVDRDELAAAVRRVRINADVSTAAIVLEANFGKVTVVARDKFGNSASESVPATSATDGRVLCVNHIFLAEMLAAHPEKEARFLLGKDLGKRRSVLLLQGRDSVQVITQMSPALVGY